MKKHIIYLFTLGLITLLMAGCDVQPNGPEDQKDISIYAVLSKVNGNWQISNITLTPLQGYVNNNGISVNLTTSQALVDTTSIKGCFGFVILKNTGIKDINCDKSSKKLFRYQRLDIISNIMGTVGTVGLNVAMGQYAYDSVFDYSKFNNTLAEAKKAAGITRQVLHNISEVYYRMPKVCTIESQKLKTFYNQPMVDAIQVIDQSGLAKIHRPPAILLEREISYDPISNACHQFKSVYGKVYPSIDALSGELVTLLENSSGIPESQQAGFITLECVMPENPNRNNYNIKIVCKKMNFLKGKLDKNITYNLTSRKFTHKEIFHYINSDRFIDLVYDGELMKMRNKTEEFMRLEAFSAYLNQQVVTESEAYKVQFPLELPPLGTIKVSVLKKYALNFPNITEMTMTKIRKFKAKFGFAVKYSLIKSNIKNTLFKRIDIPQNRFLIPYKI